MTKAISYVPDPTAMLRIFNTFDSIRYKEAPLAQLFPNLFDLFLSENRISLPKGAKITKMGFTANLLTDSVFFFMDFDNMGVPIYEAGKAYFEQQGFDGILMPDNMDDTVSFIMPAGNGHYYRFSYICLNKTKVRPLYAFDHISA